MTWKNDLRDGVSKLAIKDFTTSCVQNDPLIHNGYTMNGMKD